MAPYWEIRSRWNRRHEPDRHRPCSRALRFRSQAPKELLSGLRPQTVCQPSVDRPGVVTELPPSASWRMRSLYRTSPCAVYRSGASLCTHEREGLRRGQQPGAWSRRSPPARQLAASRRSRSARASGAGGDGEGALRRSHHISATGRRVSTAAFILSPLRPTNRASRAR
jgi:hypothetical protein